MYFAKNLNPNKYWEVAVRGHHFFLLIEKPKHLGEAQ
jgi:hypothetical protein